MSKTLDKILIVDVESTCWQERDYYKNKTSEIIEIGICALDIQTGESTVPESIIIKPQHSVVSEFCTKLTTLTQENVDGGISYEEAINYLQPIYDMKNRIWASYGDYDRKMFFEMSKLFKLRYPFSQTHINIKSWFALSRRMKKEVGTGKAIELLGLTFEGTPHRAVDDVLNITKIFKNILKYE